MAKRKGEIEVQRVFTLNSAKSFNSAERFKSKLEDNGYRVMVTTHGLNGVRIKGTKRRRNG